MDIHTPLINSDKIDKAKWSPILLNCMRSIYYASLFLIYPLMLASSLSCLSTTSLAPLIANGKISLGSLNGFFVTEMQNAISLFSAFLSRHLLNYDKELFKAELERIHSNGVLSILLSDSYSQGVTIFDEFHNKGLFNTIADTTNRIVSEINIGVSVHLQSSIKENIELVEGFLANLFFLRNFYDLEELGPIILKCIMLEEFGEERGNQILKALINYQEVLGDFIQLSCAVTYAVNIEEENTAFIDKPLTYLRKILDQRREIERYFEFKSRDDLFTTLRLPTKTLLFFATNIEKGLVVIAMILVRARFGIEIDGGEGNDLKSQMEIAQADNYHTYLILESDLATGNEEIPL